MFRSLGIFGLAVVVAAVLFDALTLRRRRSARLTGEPAPRFRAGERVVYALALLSLGAMAVTGLLSALSGGAGSLNGWMLWVHFGVAPLFIFALLGLVVLWGERSRFGRDHGGGPADAARRRPFGALSRVLFWGVAVLGFVTIASILVSMAPLFSSDCQYTLYKVHRYSALLLTMVALAHAYVLTLPTRLPTTLVAGGPAPGDRVELPAGA